MNIFIDMVGCRLNQSEIEQFAFQLRAAGHQIVSDASDAEIAIVNTCTVTASAAADSRKVIRRIARAGCPRIIATGCLSTIDPDQVLALPSISKIIPNQNKENLVESISGTISIKAAKKIKRQPLPGKNKRTRAFIKVQDGCDNFCTFCITRVARGRSRSISEKNIFRDIEFALLGGAKEIVLTGVNLGSWGCDLPGSSRLSDLMTKIIERYKIPRIRLSSIEPWDIDQDLIDLFKNPVFCPHFHLPLQSGCDQTLSRMGRRITTNQFEKLIERIRLINRKISITTDIMVGFPGETEIEFNTSLSFIKGINFSDGHVFRYSPRRGTPAFSYQQKVQESTKKERSKLMRDVILKSKLEYWQKNIGNKVFALWERSEKLNNNTYKFSGLSENYIPIEALSSTDLYNQISNVEIQNIIQNRVCGKIIN